MSLSIKYKKYKHIFKIPFINQIGENPTPGKPGVEHLGDLVIHRRPLGVGRRK